MAKKILYKVKAYHCPRCGGIVEPTKKYCEYCERELSLRNENHRKRNSRVLIDLEPYVYFDEITSFEQFGGESEYIDVSTAYDDRHVYIKGLSVPPRFNFEMPLTKRGRELSNLKIGGIRNIRFEFLDFDKAFEFQGYLGEKATDMLSSTIPQIKFSLISTEELKIYDSAIPSDILDVLRCPNCGAPIKSKYGACDFCSGWSEVEW